MKNTLARIKSGSDNEEEKLCKFLNVQKSFICSIAKPGNNSNVFQLVIR
jgi:hypothetical protein